MSNYHIYRISKYNPEYRIDGIYTQKEWDSVSDLGKVFDGKMLTETEIKNVLNNYIACMNEILLCVGARKMKIKDLESYDDHLPWRENQIVDDIRKLLFDCLSDKCWCKISWGKTYI